MKGFRKLGTKIYLSLLLIAVILFVLDFNVHSVIKKEAVLGVSTSSSKIKYPILNNSYKPEISAKGAVVMDAGSGVVIYSKNPNIRFSPASTTKIMTALTALSYFSPDSILTVKTATSEGVLLGLREGQKFSFKNLLYALLLPSANDAAFTLSQNFPNSTKGFVMKMNQNASKFNLYNTHYKDPAGLDDDGDYTTPLDLARLASIAVRNKIFSQIVSTKEKIIKDTQGESYFLKNLNKLLGIDDVNGIKTGTTEGAGQVLVTSQKVGEHTIIIVVMESADRFADTEKLLGMTDSITYLPLSIHP